MRFNPFKSRHCRDVRNRVGSGMIRALEQGITEPFEAVVQELASRTLTPPCRRYIDDRRTRLARLLKTAKSTPLHPFFDRAALLWDLRLYFELHEWLEKRWAMSRGDEKIWLQGLIRAAVAFEQLEYGRTGPAKTISAKAIQGITPYRDKFAAVFESDMILDKLKRLTA